MTRTASNKSFILYDEVKKPATECPICWEDLTGALLVIQPCKHAIHPNCFESFRKNDQARYNKSHPLPE